MSDASTESRVAVLPPTRADGVAIGKVLAASGIPHQLFRNLPELCSAIDAGVGMALLGEEALEDDRESLAACIARQPLWSDLPILLLSRSGREIGMLDGSIADLGNVSVVERPIRPTTLVSLIRSNQRARARQYEIREYLERQSRGELEREHLLSSERAARSEAERSSRMKDEFLATLSHELRTPLNAVLGWSQVLRQFRAIPDEVAQGLTVIERNARAQAQIIEDLLDMSGIISGKVRLEIERVDLGAIISSTVETVRPTAEAKNIRLDVDIEPRGAFARGDPNRLQQVFWNLLTNAVKFTSSGGRIDVTLRHLDTHVEVEVADDGQGIDAAFLPHVFDRFRQADASSTRPHGGLGLGLSIVKQLVELHGGLISAHSDGAGRGATFRIRLPAVGAAEAVTASDRRLGPSEPSTRRSALAAPLGATLDGLAVLVVDDEPDSRSLIQRLLEDRRASVSTAASAAEAIEQLAAHVPDAIISDIGMPGEDGYSLIKRIRAMPGPVAQVPAIALTAYARKEDRLRALNAGYQLHLAKPVEPGELVTMLRSIVRRSARTESAPPEASQRR